MKKLLSIFLAFLFFCSCGETLPQEPAELPTLEEPVFENEPLIALPPKSLCEFREGVVKFSSIDPESDFAKGAVDFVKAYLDKMYSQYDYIESFEVTNVEIDMNTTSWWLNLYYYDDTITSEDIENNFLVVRHRTNVKIKDGATVDSFADTDFSEPLEGHFFVIYDPENKYEFESIKGYDWKIFNRDPWPWNNDVIHTEKDIFDTLYSFGTVALPLHTSLIPDDELAVSAVEQTKENLESALKLDRNVLDYEIIDVKANINHTNFGINTNQFKNFTTVALENLALCVSMKWKMDLAENPSIYKDSVFGGFYYDYDNVPIENSLYLICDGGVWKTVGSSTYPFNAFDNLTENDLIEAINGLN
ncbi:MAG: hypothetical protein IJM98_05560 [Oscillospiraceae bacterium]|nr:hypothetical protein [Oscillospiraceae bacterium]